MRKVAIILLAAAISALFCSPASAQPHFILSGDPTATVIHQLAKDFLQRVSCEDASGAMALFAGPADHRALLEAQLRCFAHANKMARALAKTADAKVTTDRFNERLLHGAPEEQEQRVIIRNGDLATIAGSMTPDSGLDFQLIEGKWKVIHLIASPRDLTGPTKFYNEVTDACDRALAMIDAGKSDKDPEYRNAGKAIMSRLRKSWLDDPTEKPVNESGLPLVKVEAAPSLHRLAGAIGKPLADPDVQAIISSLPGLPRISLFKDIFFITSHEAGLALNFGWPSAKLIGVYVYGPGNAEYFPYPGTLPHDLKFSEPRGSVEMKLGRASFYGGGDTLPLTAFYSRAGLGIDYVRPAGRDPTNPIWRISINAPNLSASAPSTKNVATGQRLTFRLVVPVNNPAADRAEKLVDPASSVRKRTLLVDRKVLIDESMIEAITGPYPAEDGDGLFISLKMTAEGAAKLGDITTAHVGETLAIVLDGKVLMAPRITSKISTQVAIYFGSSVSKEYGYQVADTLKNIVYALPETGQR